MTHNGPLRSASAAPRRKVLISGAGIAGPALAFWLVRRGLAVTVVEKAESHRVGGYPVDIRGTALEVVRRMGVLPRLREAHVDMRRLTFLEGDGAEVASLDPYTLTGSVEGEDLEIPRGDLARVLYESVRGDAEFVFGDAVGSLHQHDHGVDVAFRGGAERTFDLVFGADGLHSRTRETVFGPEEPFHRYLGYCFAGFTMPDTFGLEGEGVMWNDPGRAAALYAVKGAGEVHTLLNFARTRPPFEAFRDPEAQRDLVASVFAGAGWKVPEMLAAMREAGDLFFDSVSQIRMPRWSSGRVALVGDAAYAPSFVTGQGTSLALVGAYMLAASLDERDHAAGFAAYEDGTRAFVTAHQGRVEAGEAALFPTTVHALERRNEMLRGLAATPRAAQGRPSHSALTLPEPGRPV